MPQRDLLIVLAMIVVSIALLLVSSGNVVVIFAVAVGWTVLFVARRAERRERAEHPER